MGRELDMVKRKRAKTQAPRGKPLTALQINEKEQRTEQKILGRGANKARSAITDEDRQELGLNKFEDAFTLAELQDKIKRQSDLYKREFKAHLNIFVGKLKELKENPAKKDQELIDYFKFMAHVSGVYRQQIASFLSTEMINLLQQYFSILNPEVRRTLVTCLKIMRGKDVVPAATVIPVLLKLFRCQDKQLRKFLHGVIISDLKMLNQKAKNHALNRKLQGFIHGLLNDPHEDAARRSLNVMVELYKRRVWNDDKSVNVLWRGAVHDNPKIVTAACKFFLALDYDMQEDSASESSEELESKIDALKGRKHSRLGKGKRKELDKAVKTQKRREKRRATRVQTDFLPIDMVYDPQACAEALFSKLKKSNDKYDVKLYMLRLVSRLIGRHRLQLLQFYPHVLRYMTSHSKEQIGEIFAMIIESVHELVAPETIKPVISRIIENFVTEQCPDQNVTVGLNAIREILMRQPLALDEATIEYLCEFRSYKNKSVMAAARSLINFFREVCPSLLPKKMLGREKQFLGQDDPELAYGEVDMKRGVDGAHLLKEGDNIAAERILTNTDLKKIKVLKLRKAMQRVDKGMFKDEDGEQGGMPEMEAESQDEDEEDDDMGEMGESEMEEYGEEDMSGEEGSEVEDAPELIPMGQEEEKDEIDDDSDSYISSIDPIQANAERDSVHSSELHTSQLDSSEEADAAKNQGFMYEHMLNTFTKHRTDRILDQKKTEKQQKAKDKHKNKREEKAKHHGQSNIAQLKNKPMAMVLPKKVQEMHYANHTSNMKRKVRIRQLGKFTKQTKQRLESKKKKAGQVNW